MKAAALGVMLLGAAVAADAASAVSGLVTGPGGTPPLSGIVVRVYQLVSFDWQAVAPDATTGTNGLYFKGGLTDTVCHVEFLDPTGHYAGEFYNNQYSVFTATDVPLAPNSTTSNINVSLDLPGALEGRVVETGTGIALEGILVSAWSDNGFYWEPIDSVSSDTDGGYRFAGLHAGIYRLYFEDTNVVHVSEWYDNAAFLEDATDLSVFAGVTSSVPDVALDGIGSIQGRVTRSGGAGLTNIQVTAEAGDGFGWAVDAVTRSRADGTYEIPDLAPGPHRVRFDDDSGWYATQWFTNAFRAGSAATVTVIAGQARANINALLTRGLTLMGTVTGPDGTTPLADVRVEAHRAYGGGFEFFSETLTAANGGYTHSGLPTGAAYVLHFVDDSGTYAPEWFNNAANASTASNLTGAAGATNRNLNASLAVAGSSIAGRVTRFNGITPLAGIDVSVWTNQDDFLEYIDGATSAGNGAYVVGGLAPGAYSVMFLDASARYLEQWFTNAADSSYATPVVLGPNEARTNVSAALALDLQTPNITDIRLGTSAVFQLTVAGTAGMTNWTQVASLTNTLLSAWTNIGTPFVSGAETSTVQVAPSGAGRLWRFRMGE